MKKICLFIQWITFNKVCLGYCQKGYKKKYKGQGR
jgi:hypothetical protein